MIELAKSYGANVSPVNVIAKNQNISERYLQNILLILVDAGLVKSVRGKNGGFVLAKEPAQINLAEISMALEEDKCLIECSDDEKGCESASIRIMNKVWEKASETLYSFLSGITLSELARMSGEHEFGEKIFDFII
jgi:Rrf2 family protein